MKKVRCVYKHSGAYGITLDNVYDVVGYSLDKLMNIELVKIINDYNEQRDYLFRSMSRDYILKNVFNDVTAEIRVETIDDILR